MKPDHFSDSAALLSQALVVALLMALALAALPVYAQNTPTKEQMIEQLKQPRTRSLRNLTVEAVKPGDTATQQGGNASAHAPSVAPANAPPGDAPGSASAIEAAARPSLSLLIQFDFNSARVKPESQQALATLSQALLSAELSKSKFAIEGHTDAKGSVEYNRKLSEQRAIAVRELLRIQGVAETRLIASGKGASELANSADPLAAENRRVRVVNLD